MCITDRPTSKDKLILMKKVALNKSSLLLNIILPNTQMLQLILIGNYIQK